MKSDSSFLWIAGGAAAAIGLMIFVSDLPSGFFSESPAKPVAGKVYQLTTTNLSVARRNAPVLVALFTRKGNTAGARMARGLDSLAQSVRGRAIVALGNLDEDPDLAEKAGVDALPVWVVYAGGNEVGRATGENADLSVERLIAGQTAPPP